jgi:hypothetical protein
VVRSEIVEVGLEEPEGLRDALALSLCRAWCRAHQKCTIDGLFAQVYDELLQGHGLVVDANEEVAYSVPVSALHPLRNGGARTAAGRTQSPRTQTGAAWSRAHSGCQHARRIVCAAVRQWGSSKPTVAVLCGTAGGRNGGFRTHERYATVSEGSWLK